MRTSSHHQTSNKGKLCDSYTGLVKDSFVYLGLTIGFYNQTEDIAVWYLGFLMYIFRILPDKLTSEVKNVLGPEEMESMKKDVKDPENAMLSKGFFNIKLLSSVILRTLCEFFKICCNICFKREYYDVETCVFN